MEKPKRTQPRDRGEQEPAGPWYFPLTIDLLARVVAMTALHPFICWLVPLCLRARAVALGAAEMQAAVTWAVLVTGVWLATALDRRIAYGSASPRPADDNGEVVVVTGGAAGLGLAVAHMYAMRGAAVAVLDVRALDSSAAAAGIALYRCDVGDRAQVRRAAAEIERDLGSPTVLVNNAAVVVGKPLLDMTDAELDGSLATNLLAHFYTVRAFLPAMARNRHGALVTVSSVMAHIGGAARLVDYAAAKAGVSAMHAGLATELRISAPGVRAVLIEPGQLRTPLFYGVRTPSQFFAPVVEPVAVARDIVAAVDAGRGAVLSMPLYARYIHWLAVLPPSLQLLARRLAGVNNAMNRFRGRDGWTHDAAAAQERRNHFIADRVNGRTLHRGG